MSVATILCAAFATVAVGQEQRPAWYFIVQEMVKPSMTMQYESATREMIELLQSKDVSAEDVRFWTANGPEMGYVYVMSMENMAAMDRMMESWQVTLQSLGEKWEELEAKTSEATDHRISFHSVRRDDLSYQPESPRIKEDEVKQVFYGFHYVIPGKEREFEQVARDYAALYKEKGLDDSWTLYQRVTGGELPLYVATFPARSASDHYARMEEIQGMLGEAGQKLAQRAYACMRRFERKEVMPRPDLSYPPGE
jgi:hypothetical protein